MILHKEIERLKRQLMALAALVEERVSIAMTSVETRDAELAQIVIRGDNEIDELEVDLEEECLKVLALHQPVAIDLRVIVAALKINNDLERIGDLAMDIAERAEFFATHEAIHIPFDFSGMAENVQTMLQKCLDAFVNLDATLAQQVCAADDAVDAMHRQMYQGVREAIVRDPEHIEQYISCLTLSRFLERIADHCTNISEDILYIVDGNVVRHSGEIYGVRQI